jgi:transcriptional regulator with XRE-family HTH domain
MEQEIKDKPTRLRVILATRGLKQKDLANMANLELYQVSKICSGLTKNIMLDTAKKISKALGVTIEEAFGDDDEQIKNEN